MRSFATNVVLVCLVSAGSAAAQTDDKTAQYFEDGLKLMSEGESHYAEACVAFEHALALNGGAGTKFNLADCYEKTRRPASALPLFRQVEDITRQAGQKERSDSAKARGDVVEKRIPKLTIQAPWVTQHPDATLTLDGKPLLPAALDVPMPLDFGKHEVVAHLGAYESEASVDLEMDGQTARLNVQMPTPPVVMPSTDASSTERGEASHTQRNIGWIVGGVGIATVIVGSAVALSAKGKYEACDQNLCSSSSTTEKDKSARSQADVATVVDVVGLVLVATGVTLWATAPSTATTGSLHVTPSVGTNQASLLAGGTF